MNFPLLLEYGGERTTGVEGEAETPNSQPLSPVAMTRRVPRGNRLIVRRTSSGLFELRTFKNGRELECVHAMDAQMIVDYVAVTWPVGTVIDWVIVPAARKETAHRQFSDRKRYLARHTWLVAPPIGARL